MTMIDVGDNIAGEQEGGDSSTEILRTRSNCVSCCTAQRLLETIVVNGSAVQAVDCLPISGA